MGRKKKTYKADIVNTNLAEENIIEQYEICKAKYSDGFIFLNFKGYGLIIPNEKGYNSPELKVYYEGTIGKPDFKFNV